MSKTGYKIGMVIGSVLLLTSISLNIWGQALPNGLSYLRVPTASISPVFGTPNDTSENGVFYRPPSFDTSAPTRKYPLIIHFHGSGEAGDAAHGGPNPQRLFANGLPKNLYEGMTLTNILNPADGKRYDFLMYAPQSESYQANDPGTIPQICRYFINNWRVDPNRIYLMGLSAGGEATFQAIAIQDSIAQYITAANPQSGPLVTNGFVDFANNGGNYTPWNWSIIANRKIKVYFLSGSKEDTTTYKKLRDSINIKSGNTRMAYQYGDPVTQVHCCWITYDSLNYKLPYTNNGNLYQWFLTSTKGSDPYIYTAPTSTPVYLPIIFSSFNVKREKDNSYTASFTAEHTEQTKEFSLRYSEDGGKTWKYAHRWEVDRINNNYKTTVRL